MMGYLGGYGLLGGFGMWFGMILVIGIIVLAAWAFVGLLGKGAARPGEPPLDILKRRYALGEMTETEFAKAKADLV